MKISKKNSIKGQIALRKYSLLRPVWNNLFIRRMKPHLRIIQAKLWRVNYPFKRIVYKTDETPLTH